MLIKLERQSTMSSREMANQNHWPFDRPVRDQLKISACPCKTDWFRSTNFI